MAIIRVKKNLPDASQVYVSRPLTSYAFAFMQSEEGFIHNKVFPNLPVDDQTGSIWTLPKGTFTRDEFRKRGPLSRAREIDWSPGLTTYQCEPWALKIVISDLVRNAARMPFTVDQVNTKILLTQALIRKERDFVSRFMTTSVWTQDVTGNTSASAITPTGGTIRQWNDPASTPLEDIAELMTIQQVRTEGQRPTGLAMGRQVWDKLKNHPQILDRLNRGQTTGPAQIRKADVAALFELEEIVVADAVWNTANEGQAVSDALIVGKSALLYYATPTPQMMIPTAGLTLGWRGFMDGRANDMGVAVEQYRMPDVKGVHTEANMAYGMKLISPDHGTFLTSVVA